MLVNNTLKVIMNLIKIGYYKVQHVVHTVTDIGFYESIEIPRLGIPLDSTNQLDSRNQLDSMKPRETMKPMNTFRKPPCSSTSSNDEIENEIKRFLHGDNDEQDNEHIYIPYDGPYSETPGCWIT